MPSKSVPSSFLSPRLSLSLHGNILFLLDIHHYLGNLTFIFQFRENYLLPQAKIDRHSIDGLDFVTKSKTSLRGSYCKAPMVTPIDTKRGIDPPRLGERHEVRSTPRGVGPGEFDRMHRPTRRTGKLDGMLSPTRKTGELDGVIDPTRGTSELDDMVSATRRTGELDGAFVPTRRTGELDGEFDPTRPFSELKQHTFRLQGFPLSLQLVAFHAIPQILSYIPAPIDQKTIMDLEDDYLPQHPSISSRDIRRVEFDPDHVVTPIIPIESQTQLGWGVWPNDPKVDSVIYMEQLIADHHSFNKEVWPGGVTSEPLIVKPKQRVKKKVSASIKQSLKPRQVKKKHPSIRKQRRISSYFTHATKTTFTNEQLTEIVIKLQSNMKNLKQLIKRIKKKSHGRQTPFHERLSRRKKTATPQQTDQPGPELHDAPIDQDDHTMETDDLPECQYPIISQYAAQLHRLAT
uniref:Uncharacterized protein n=1 Tax=Brassica campestris TaxID=3711 RepID=A0A3P5ZVZ7_BRACM|nr:unnamed protein product [Brassica rapa]